MVEARDRISEKPGEYWVLEKNPELLAEHVSGRVDNYFQRMRSSYYMRSVFRSWSYYHGLYFEPGVDLTAVRQFGAQGEVLAVSINHLRNFVQHTLTLSTQDRPDFETRATSSDAASLKQAELGDNVLDHYLREEYLEEFYNKALEHALVLNTGYVHSPWDWNLGEEKAALKAGEDEGGEMEIYREGDFSISNPTIFDVAYDLGLRDWRRLQWVIVRTYENRYDLAETVNDKETADKILAIDYNEDLKQESLYKFGIIGAYGVAMDDSDLVPVWHLYHLDSPAVPGGVQFRVAGDSIPIGDPEKLKYEKGNALPLFRVCPYEVIFSTLGYSVANDLQGPQEIFNQETSTIATNHKACGFQIVTRPEGWEIEDDNLNEDGVVIIAADGPTNMEPKGISLVAPQGEFYKFRDAIVRDMEALSGINSAVRGQPEKQLKSGESLKVMASQAVQLSGPVQRARRNLIGEHGTFLLRGMRDIPRKDDQRVISLVGDSNRSHLHRFIPEDLAGVDRVTVTAGSPLAKTVSGRLAIADSLLEKGMVKTPEEYITVMETGRLEPLIKADKAQLDLVHDENEALREGDPVQINHLTDAHMLHIREHGVIISSTESRLDPDRHMIVLAHMMEHITALTYTGVQQMQVAMGFPIPFSASIEGYPDMQQGQGGAGPTNGGAPGVPPPGQEPGELAPIQPDAAIQKQPMAEAVGI